MTFRYKLDANNYFCWCGTNCSITGCSEYTGEVPEGFPFSVDIRCYKMVGGVITYDADKAAEIASQTIEEEAEHGLVFKCDLNYYELLSHKTTEITLGSTDTEYPSAGAVYRQIGRIDGLLDEHDGEITFLNTEYAKMILKQQGLENQITNSKNNLYLGTNFYDLSNWGVIAWNNILIESDTPPDVSTTTQDYWYCTNDYQDYVNGKVYYKDTENVTWVESGLTKKDLLEGNNNTVGTTIIDNEYTQNNFLSKRCIKLEITEDEQGFTKSSVAIINKNKEYLSLGFMIENDLERGNATIQTELSNEDLKYENNVSSYLSLYTNNFTPDDHVGLERVINKIPIINSGRILFGLSGLTAPEDTSKYWRDLNDFKVKKYNVINNVWEEDDSGWLFYDETETKYFFPQYYKGVADTISTDYETDSFLYLAEITSSTINSFSCRTLIKISNIYVEEDMIGETEPERKKGMYWCNQTTDKVYRAKYDGNTFVQWVEQTDLNYSTLPTIEIAGVTIKYIPAKGLFSIGDIKIEYGDATDWSLNENENYGVKYKFDDNGIEVKKGNNTMAIDEDEIVARYKTEKIFYINEKEMYSKNGVFEITNQDGLITKKSVMNDKTIYVRYIQ